MSQPSQSHTVHTMTSQQSNCSPHCTSHTTNVTHATSCALLWGCMTFQGRCHHSDFHSRWGMWREGTEYYWWKDWCPQCHVSTGGLLVPDNLWGAFPSLYSVPWLQQDHSQLGTTSDPWPGASLLTSFRPCLQSSPQNSPSWNPSPIRLSPEAFVNNPHSVKEV